MRTNRFFRAILWRIGLIEWYCPHDIQPMTFDTFEEFLERKGCPECVRQRRLRRKRSKRKSRKK